MLEMLLCHKCTSTNVHRYINDQHYKSYGPVTQREVPSKLLTELDIQQDYSKPGFKVTVSFVSSKFLKLTKLLYY